MVGNITQDIIGHNQVHTGILFQSNCTIQCRLFYSPFQNLKAVRAGDVRLSRGNRKLYHGKEMRNVFSAFPVSVSARSYERGTVAERFT